MATASVYAVWMGDFGQSLDDGSKILVAVEGSRIRLYRLFLVSFIFSLAMCMMCL